VGRKAEAVSLCKGVAVCHVKRKWDAKYERSNQYGLEASFIKRSFKETGNAKGQQTKRETDGTPVRLKYVPVQNLTKTRKPHWKRLAACG
jgi:hypothetical protein